MSNIFFLGDQTAEQYPLLKKVILRNKNALVSTFCERIALALRDEVTKLPRPQRDAIPDFLTLNDLVESYYAKGDKIPQIESVMVTIAQLGHYVG